MLNKLVDLGHRIASKAPHWVQGSGGNISVKYRERNRYLLAIKASGFRLRDLKPNSGIVVLDLAKLLAGFSDLRNSLDPEEHLTDLQLRSTISHKSKNRPSIETGFHAILPEPIVIHFHSVVCLVMADLHRKKDRKFAKFVKGLNRDLAFLPQLKPGFQLCEAIWDNPGKRFYLLENHGIIICGENSAELDHWEEVERDFCDKFRLNNLLSPLRANELVAPLKMYFPDVAVFLDRIASLLTPVDENNFTLKRDSARIDPDSFELWVAICLIFKNYPNLPELSVDYCGKVRGMPMEQYRKSLYAY